MVENLKFGLFVRFTLFTLLILFYQVLPCKSQELPPEEIQVDFNSYFDNFGVSIIYPEVSFSKSLSEGTSINGRVLVDVITTASMKSHFDSVYSFVNTRQGLDAYTSASMRTHGGSDNFPDELRGEFGIGLVQLLGDATVSLTNLYSVEHDYSSETIAGSLSIPFAKKNTTVQLGLVKSWDKNYPQTRTWTADKSVISSTLTLTQIFSTDFIAQLEFYYSNSDGFLSDPYQVVTVVNYDSSYLQKYENIYPDYRNRGAAGLRTVIRLADVSSLQLGYRYYADDWDIKSHTLSGLYQHQLFDDKFLLGAGIRSYFQNKAKFFKAEYNNTEEFMSVDPKLNGIISNEFEFNLSLNGSLIPIIENEKLELNARFNFYIRETNSPDWHSKYDMLYAFLMSIGFRFLLN
ncbi:MAG: hypothetical protein A2X61_06825 [Ignavibacteria bacterium GWB2_35_12]|nr:MAG: hypothetical protein A2X63_10575 [Ignavibacteria bacterium GWA2_35_8]OGU40096.1 MAG: hypothetical protein A2X61_06825 [Ignavibacteria bacterium GWB2_35_12]OGU87411.1 MAG: hypothetical protein A2220_01375 [Ignavibacteria bacterium RIFOXYA2_FULL_35_10]OGV22026.1 MAG: hypothetical protein A2475_09325 [Ignavibacteria bacterium RIFOXYC2_FULL_35_21]